MQARANESTAEIMYPLKWNNNKLTKTTVPSLFDEQKTKGFVDQLVFSCSLNYITLTFKTDNACIPAGNLNSNIATKNKAKNHTKQHNFLTGWVGPSIHSIDDVACRGQMSSKPVTPLPSFTNKMLHPLKTCKYNKE